MTSTMSPETLIWSILIALFLAVVGVSYVVGSIVTERGVVRQRLGRGHPGAFAPGPSVLGTVKSKINIEILVDQATRSRQRLTLLQAGFFGSQAVVNYNLARLGLVFLFPAALYIFILNRLHTWDTAAKFLIIAAAVTLAYFLPSGYVSRRTRQLQDQYRTNFPDLLDLLVVCVDAGLSLEAALERVARDISTTNREMGINLEIMAAEMRAGRGTVDGMKGFAERLGLEEAKSLAMLLQQSLELGTDITQALRTFADEMRDKRMARAEERALKLPVKLTLPLGAFIFPVVLIVVMTPLILNIMATFGNVGK